MVLIINSGSATLKFKVFTSNLNLKEYCWGIVERIGLKKSFFIWQFKGKKARQINYAQGVPNHQKAMQIVFQQLRGLPLRAIGHRVVHGGEEFVEPTLITPAILKRLEKYSQLAPLHNPANLAGIKACLKLLPQVPNIAVFDTAFYQTLSAHAYLYPLPFALYKKYKIRKYGFHGISHQYVAEEAAKKLGKSLAKLNLITCHLGSGCSITAIKNGKAIDTSMGFTPLEGLMMSTRSGNIDPAIILYLIQELKMKPQGVDALLNEQSGLRGIAGVKDMREVLQAAKSGRGLAKKMAKLALQMFVYRAQQYIGAYATVLGGVDAIVFTAGIGERSAIVRQLILEGLKSLGKFKVLVIPTNEELMIARCVKKFAGTL